MTRLPVVSGRGSGTGGMPYSATMLRAAALLLLLLGTAIEGRRLSATTAGWRALAQADPVQIKRTLPELQTAIARDDVGTLDPFGLGRALSNSFHPERSGDVLMVMKPFHVLEAEKGGTSHGTPWSYDSDVPIFLFGKGVKPGVYASTVHPTDVAPTMSAILEMGAPASNEGVVLFEALTLPR